MKRFPIFHQRDAMDCGPTCLRMISAWYGRQYGVEQLRKHCNIGRAGVSIMGIAEAAEIIGMRSLAVKVTWERFSREVPLPCIAHWEQNHFVVVCAIKHGKVHVADPAKGKLVYPKDEFISGWMSQAALRNAEETGILMLLEPSPTFYETETPDEGEKPGILYFLSYLRPHRRILIQLGIGMCGGLVLDLIFPFLTQSVVDQGISNLDLNLITLLLVGQLMMILGQTAIDIIRSWILMEAGSRIGMSLVSDFLNKVLRLPMSFFDTRSTGDIMQRIHDHSRVEDFLTSSSINMVFSVLSFFVFGVILAIYGWVLLGVFLLFTVLTVLWLLIFMKQRRLVDEKCFGLDSRVRDKFVELVSGVCEIKLQGMERSKRWEWENLSVQNFRASMRGLVVENAQRVGLVFLSQTRNILITFLSARAVINGDITLGMMLSSQYIVGQLNAPVQALLSFIHEAHDAKLSLERMGEVWSVADESQTHHERLNVLPPSRTITFSNVSFRYQGAGQQDVLNKLNMIIPAEKVTAIVGPSGSGKTTLLKLLLGLYEPTGGDIYLGDVPLSSLNLKIWREHCGAVMQDGFIFPDTIERNVVCASPTVDVARLQYALKFACLDEWVQSLPLHSRTKIGDDGQDLSGGQKQRLLMARAVYGNPEFIFLDEATSALDARNERAVMNHLREFLPGHTALIIAHRLSTVKNADQILVMDGGQIVEQGTHEELVNLRGLYFSLVRNQLDLETKGGLSATHPSDT
jgi:ATP-binding cassette, subfamily B, bacterial